MLDSKLTRQTNNLRNNLISLSIILLVGVVLYGHTLHAPWYMDDAHVIVENPSIRLLGNALQDFFSVSRGPAILTFALNYHFGGLDVTGYHVVNILIHLINAVLVFYILKRVFRNRQMFILAGALIFVAHPLQTQAVTYIVQRMTSLAALFFFLAIYLFILFRESSDRGRKKWVFYGLALVAGGLAVTTKQNTAVLPLVLILLDRYFLNRNNPTSWRALLLQVSPFILIPAVLAAQLLLIPLLTQADISTIGGMPDLTHLRNNSPLNYLVTQFSVIFIYLRLLILPYGQALDYDVAIVSSIWSWQSGIALLGICTLVAAAIYLRRREPLISAGILWFFLGLAVESSVIPLDPVFEHRLYISMFGYLLIVLALIAKLPQRIIPATLMLFITVLAVLTWQRNNLWNDPLAFHQDNLRRAPASERVHLDLGNAFLRANRPEDAQSVFEGALRINPDYVPIHVNLARAYAALNQHQKAINTLLIAASKGSGNARLFNNLGALYNEQGNFIEAANHFQRAVMLDPYDARIHFNLALTLERLGRFDVAIRHYQQSIDLDSTDPAAFFNLGVILHRQEKLQLALDAFLRANQLNPQHAGTLLNAALTYLDLGNISAAQNILPLLENLDRNMAGRLQQRILQSRR